MFTIIVTIRSVLWSVMTILATLMVLIALFSDRWIIGQLHIPRSLESLENTGHMLADKTNQFLEGRKINRHLTLGIFLDCKKPKGDLFFYGECLPDLERLELQMNSDNDEYPHAWKIGVGCLLIGLLIMIITVLWSILSPFSYYCSIFSLGCVLQLMAAVLFTTGLLSYAAGWGSDKVRVVCGASQPFQEGDCQIGEGFWLAVSGTLGTYIAAYLATRAYNSTHTGKAAHMIEDGDRIVCAY